MLKYIIIAIFLTNLVICQELNNYTKITLAAGEIYTLDVPQDSEKLDLYFISADKSTFSAYVLDQLDYIQNYQTKNFRNGDMLDGFCTNFLSCNTTVDIDYSIDYKIVIVNENIFLDGTLNYNVMYYNYTIYAWIIIIASVLASIVILTIITVTIVIIVKKCKNKN